MIILSDDKKLQAVQEAFSKVNDEAVENEKKSIESINFDACYSKIF